MPIIIPIAGENTNFVTVIIDYFDMKAQLLERYFHINASGSTIRTEFFAGFTTFLTMAYILAVNPSILSAAGMDSGAVFTATAVSAILATLIMGFGANLPFSLASGMGLNAFFAYTVCCSMGYSWQFALTAVLLEGIIFVLLTVLKVRNLVLEAVPVSLRKAIGVGIGLFIAFNGFVQAGIVVSNKDTVVALGDLTSSGPLLMMLGVVVISWLLAKKVAGGMLLGMLLITLLGIPMGVTHFNGVVAAPPSLKPVFLQFEFSQIFTKDMWLVVLTLFFVDFFDTMGTLVGVSEKVEALRDPRYGNRLQRAFMADAVGTVLGAMLGTNTVTTYMESTAGIAAGGRTGLTAVVSALFFVLALFLAPVFLAIPVAATSAVLVVVGVFMLTAVRDIPWEDFTEAIPAFVCLIVMPFTFSIAEGIVLGMLAYVLINVLCGNWKKISITMYVLAVIFLLKYAM